MAVEIPKFPVLGIYNSNVVIGAGKEDELTMSSLHGICFLDRQAMRYFDADGNVWTADIAKAPYPVNAWTKVLCRVYNPKFRVELSWKNEGTYAFQDLQEEICKCVDEDDDILTQFIEADKLKAGIREAKSLGEAFNLLRKAHAA